MSTKEKLVERFKTPPRDFTFDELKTLMKHCGFSLQNSGKTSGSRVCFVKGSTLLKMHRPHPGDIVQMGTLKNIHAYLEANGLI